MILAAPFIVTLTEQDALDAARVATLQICRKVEFGRGDGERGFSRRGLMQRWQNGILGCLGEIAVAKALGLEWTPGGQSVSRGDVDGRIEVRSTDYETGHLVLYEDDSNTSDFVLAVGSFPRFRLAGLIRGFDAKEKRFWKADADPPCYWVPQRELVPVGQ